MECSLAEGRSVSYLRCILQSFYRKLRYFYVRWAPCHLVIMKRSFVFSEIWLCSELSLQGACVCQMLRDDLQRCASVVESIDRRVMSASPEDYPGWFWNCKTV